MSRWFRFYESALHDPKMQRLSGDLFKTWVNILCVASAHGGVLPGAADLAFLLHLDASTLKRRLDALMSAGLIDAGADGQLAPHSWATRQFQTDTSAARTKTYRERKKQSQEVTPKCDVTSDVAVTPPEADTETEIDIPPSPLASDNGSPTPGAKAPEPRAKRARREWAPDPKHDQAWASFCEAYPKRKGSESGLTARKAFEKAIKKGHDAEAIVQGARRYRNQQRELGKIGTEFIAMRATWLNQERWVAEAEPVLTEEERRRRIVAATLRN